MDFSLFLQLVVSGITMGSIYALIALGYMTIYNASGIINFAQGDFVMLGGILTVFFLKSLGLPYLLAGILAVLSVTLYGLLIYTLAIYPLRSAPILILIIATLGVSIFTQNTTMLIWGRDPLSLPAIGGEVTLHMGGAALTLQSFWVLGVTGLILLLLYLMGNHTLMGKAMQASSTDPLMAQLVGISLPVMVLISFGISGVIGAIAGVFITPIFFTSYSIGAPLGLKGFVAGVLGGWGNNTGAVVGGLTLGILESLSVGFISAGYKNAIAFVILIVILYFRPRGILGSPVVD
ncbi:MAG: branched-chain amino acid ABC transporter permease [Deltaproteobacteria bacterium]|nr:branched-chain amino acid ABC transporter permease [Deltaproteobacteria bacterium]